MWIAWPNLQDGTYSCLVGVVVVEIARLALVVDAVGAILRRVLQIEGVK